MAHLLPAAPATQPWERYLQSQLPVILLIYVEQRARTPRGICSELDGSWLESGTGQLVGVRILSGQNLNVEPRRCVLNVNTLDKRDHQTLNGGGNETWISSNRA